MSDPIAKPSPIAAAVAYVTSPDGSRIAYERFGTGPAVILVGGALNDRRAKASGVPLAQRLAVRFTAFAYDRRGRGDSTEAQPSSVDREIDDLRMLIEAAGGSAALYGMSSGGALALAAAAAGLPVTRIALFEPPFTTDPAAEERAKGYATRLRELIAAGDSAGALELFLNFIGMPPQMISGMRNSPAWQSLSAMGRSLVQDADVMNNRDGAPVPNARIKTLEMPVLVMVGERSPPALRQAGERVAAVARTGSYAILPVQTHDVALDALVPVLAKFLANESMGAGRTSSALPTLHDVEP
jgi:pimeloyl-ACP methyl ester carboxylesterase